MIKESTALDLYYFYVEENCLEEGVNIENAINRNNRNGYVSKKCLKQKDNFFLTRNEYVSLLKKINMKILEEIVLHNFAFNMPFRMGELSVKKRKQSVYIDDSGNVVNTLPINWGETNKLWKKDPLAKEHKKFIRHLNLHTDGYILFFNYCKRIAHYSNKTLYSFKATDIAKEFLNKSVMENKNLDFYLK